MPIRSRIAPVLIWSGSGKPLARKQANRELGNKVKSYMSSEALSSFFQANKKSLAKGFVESAILAPRYSREQVDNDEFIERELYCLVDFIEKGICEPSEVFTNLYVGEKAKMAYVQGAKGAERNALLRDMIVKDHEVVVSLAGGNQALLEAINNFFQNLITIFDKPPEKELKVLFVGDCLHLDVMAFLIPGALVNGINIIPEVVADKNINLSLTAIAEMYDREFDLAFYSPFSYEFHKPYAELLLQKSFTSDLSKESNVISALFDEVRKVTCLLAQQFTCPIFIHNASGLLRSTGEIKTQLKRYLTVRRRENLREIIDSNLDLLMDTVNAFEGARVHKLDERRYVEKGIKEENRLGDYLYWSELQHPVRFGIELAKEYLDICKINAKLGSKKLIVCDLDNTLWDGVIGEGSVKHYNDKQTILKALKAKGVVLAIASKNDPANVKWEGSVLNESDFVYSSINWEPKVAAFSKIERDLNLKSKDFIFIDDRADERAMVVEQFPGVLALDATEQSTWKQFELLEKMLSAASTGDRTKMYLERAERNQYLNQEGQGGVDQAEMFKKLGLKICVKQAEDADLARVEELVNRTNQFNIKGSRIAKNQLAEMHGSDDYKIWTTSMSDNFGAMGMISVLITREEETSVSVDIFVLSCRVFGYDVERVILNEVKNFAKERNKSVTGVIEETMYNGPCRKVFKNNEFIEDSGLWSWNDDSVALTTPEWFEFEEA